MREIKFRGKNKKGKWVYGDLNQHDIYHKVSILENGVINNAVYPETVGQFTGIQDRTGADIYEGDIFELGVKKEVFEVHYEYGCFMAFKNGKQIGLIGELQICFIKIIGNIHDNHELLK